MKSGTFKSDISGTFVSDTSGTFGVIYSNWLNADSVKVPIASQNIRFTRNKLTTIKVRVQDSTMANSIGITTEDKPMAAGDTITIGGGSSTDTPINPVP